MQSLALPRAVHNPYQRGEMTVSTNNGLVNGEVHNLLMQFFTLGSSKIEVTSQRLLDQSQAGVYRGKRHLPPHFGHFGAIRVPYPKGLNC